jgi:hypothetical protein
MSTNMNSNTIAAWYEKSTRINPHESAVANVKRCVLACACLCSWLSSAAKAAEGYVWLEGEKPASANVKWEEAGSSHADWLSGGKWLTYGLEPDKVEKELPAGGALFSYDVAVPAGGKYALWARVGFEFARSPFEWRIDEAAWQRVENGELTRDLMELDFFAEAAWLQLAELELASGKHTLTIRIPKPVDAKGKPGRLLFGLDAICFAAGAFEPYSRYQPGEEWRGPRDEEAAGHLFDLAAPAAGERSSVALAGLWEVCRHDEQLPGETAAPIGDFPEHPRWTSIEVPGDKNTLRPDLVLAHRLWYRTRVRAPRACAGRSFVLTFPQNNLNTTVYVNGVFCGFNKNPFARFSIDVTPGFKPGEVNEIWVGIKDAWYGRTNDPEDPLVLRKTFNLPPSFFHQGFQDLAYPIWNQPQSGILQTPVLTAVGAVYASDVFVKTSVAQKQLAVEVTLKNPTHSEVKGEVLCEAIDPAGDRVAKRLPSKPFSLPAGAEQTVELADRWTDPRLWWPDEPHLYSLRTTVRLADAAADVSQTPFGFREWSIDGIHFKLNGVTFHGWCDQHSEPNKEPWLAFQRKTHQQMMRFWGTTWKGLSPDDALDFFDREGVVVRRSGIFDGEGMGYLTGENNPHLRERNKSPIKMDLANNWRDQVVAQVKGERNHPSIMLWSIENEWLYINVINSGASDPWEPVVTDVSRAVQAADPTRPNMTDGGGATKAQTLPVQGDHYITGPMTKYPALAYDANVTGGGRGRWQWDQQRPRFVGEDWFIAGNHPELACLGGEAALTGKNASLPAAGLATGILQQGYRWADYGGWDFWMNSTDADGSQYRYFAPRAVLCRQWNWTFGSGESVKRSLAIFNDTRFSDPIVLDWKLTVGGRQIAGKQSEHQVAAGENHKLEITLPLPKVDRRQEGTLALKLSVKGEEVFSDTKEVSILPVGARQPKPKQLAKVAEGQLLLYDPAGDVKEFLKDHGIAFQAIDDLDSLAETGKVLVVGKDAIDSSHRSTSALAAYAAAGRTVIVLEQREPLRYQALPAEMEAEENEGRTAFPEDLDHPALRGLAAKDFFTWGDDEILYRNAYAKPARGGRSLVQCGETLRHTALAEIAVDRGLLIVCQLVVEEKLATSAAARQLLLSLLDYGAGYRLTHRPVTVVAEADSPLTKAVAAIGLTHETARDPLQAIGQPGERIAVMEATPANLKALAGQLDRVKAFNDAGGWIIFNNLTPEGLADYNRLVGWEHLIRPFGRERVTFPSVRSRLTAGIPSGDVAMYSTKPIFPWQAGNYVVDDEFSYVIDHDEVASFGQSTFFAYNNIVNGFVSADGWPLIINFPIPKDGSPYAVPIRWPKPQTISEFTWVGNVLYWPQTKLNLIFDGDRANMATFEAEPTAEPQRFAIEPPRSASEITLEIAGWQEKQGSGPLVGIDNIYLKVQRPPEFYQRVRPMLNVGGLMEYPRGKGGMVLCNLKFQEQEEVPVNMQKKRSIFATLLRNLQAPFSGGPAVIVGTKLAFAPIDLSKQANQFRTERGWFGDKRFTFRDLPVGKQKFAGVPFEVYDFATSPVPTVVMLGGPNIPNNLADKVTGIPVNDKADALFFLHTARLDRRLTPDELKKNKRYELFRYTIHYADGETAQAPVYAEIDIDGYRQKQPQSLPGAQLGWVGRYETGDEKAVAYVRQWNNPRAGVPIASIDVSYGEDNAHGERGVPAVLAITAATAAAEK